MVCSQSPVSISSIPPVGPAIPALLISTSRPPSCSFTSTKTRSTAARSDTSASVVVIAFISALCSASLSASIACWLESQTCTRDPASTKARAITRPIPDAPPVTSTRNPACGFNICRTDMLVSVVFLVQLSLKLQAQVKLVPWPLPCSASVLASPQRRPRCPPLCPPARLLRRPSRGHRQSCGAPPSTTSYAECPVPRGSGTGRYASRDSGWSRASGRLRHAYRLLYGIRNYCAGTRVHRRLPHGHPLCRTPLAARSNGPSSSAMLPASPRSLQGRSARRAALRAGPASWAAPSTRGPDHRSTRLRLA